MAKLVVVEDSAYMRSIVCAIAEEAGHEVVTTAVDGVEGCSAVLEHDPDCLLTDLLMPNCGGVEMLENLRAEGWQGPVVVLTADVQKSTRQRCEELGVFKFLGKPPDQTELVEAITAASASTLAR